jgi:hypothetical protein
VIRNKLSNPNYDICGGYKTKNESNPMSMINKTKDFL